MQLPEACAHMWCLGSLAHPNSECLSCKACECDAFVLQVIDMDGCVGSIDTFVVEPFVPHKQEYYLCMQVRLTEDMTLQYLS